MVARLQQIKSGLQRGVPFAEEEPIKMTSIGEPEALSSIDQQRFLVYRGGVFVRDAIGENEPGAF